MPIQTCKYEQGNIMKFRGEQEELSCILDFQTTISYHQLYAFSPQKYYNKMDNEDNADKLSEARSSRDQQKNSATSKIFRSMCACFMPCLFGIKKQNIIENQETPYQKGPLDSSEYRYSKKEQSIMSQNSSYVPWEKKKNNFLIKSVYEHANRLLQDYDESLDKSTIKKWHSYSIYEYRENELLAMGTSKGRVLCKITCSRVEASAIAKKKTNQSRSYERPSDRFTSNNVDKYWNKRYLLFERFDQGISLDDESWYSVTPEAVAEHIAGKIRCDTVLDGFCGAGGNAIKLSNTCSRVICNDISGIKLKLLQKNAKVYCVQNIEMLNEDFLDIEGFEPDIVFLAPPFGSQQNLMSNSIQPNDLNPPLQKIFSKAIKMSKNIVMLLPPNINVHRLGQIIATSYIDSGIISSTCSIKIQKIFFMSQLKYMAVYIGSMIQTQINLNDQLCYIYNYLKEGEKKIFKHKKVLRFLREKYGMIRLLNYVFQLDKVQKSGTLIEKLYELIIQNNLIDEDKLARLIRQQNQQEQAYKRKKFPLMTELQSMEEQKYMGEDTDKEATLSYYSENSANKLARDSKMSQSIQARKSARSAVSSVVDKQGIELQQIPRSNTLHEATEGKQQISSNLFKSSQIRISRTQNQNE